MSARPPWAFPRTTAIHVVLLCVVVLGGDSPHGLPLIRDLEAQGYIVITTVSTAKAAENIKSLALNYVYVFVFDPTVEEVRRFALPAVAGTDLI